MPFLSKYLADFFVGYRHIDNGPFGSPEIRRVSKFNSHLETRLYGLLPKPVTVWRENKTTGLGIFSDKTIKQLDGSAILVSIVSPAYLASEWCGREVDEFIAPAGVSESLRLGNKSRLVKVVKTFVPRPQLPPVCSTEQFLAAHQKIGHVTPIDTVRSSGREPA
jgi:hypothetical protein